MRQAVLDPAKGRFFEAFFQYHRQRAERLVEVWQQGHQDDAFTLCCCYLDGLASFAYYDSKRSGYNFARLLREHGAEQELSLCSPLALVRWMEPQGGWRRLAATQLEAALGTSITKLVSLPDLEMLLISHLGKQDVQRLSKDTWRSTVASIAYQRLRNPFIHSLGGPGAVVVVNETVSEKEVSIDFLVLHRALLRALDHFDSLSRTTGKWFGHDFKP